MGHLCELQSFFKKKTKASKTKQPKIQKWWMWKTEISYRVFAYQKADIHLFSLLSILQLVIILKVKYI